MSKKYDKKNSTLLKEEETIMKISSDEEISDEEDESDLMDDSDFDNMEKLNFDFEAFPPCDSDLDGLVNLITQIFLRTDVDCEALAKKVIDQSPLGCVYKPAEEVEDEEAESIIYGVLSAIGMNGDEKFNIQILDYLLQKAKKYADKEITQKVDKIFKERKTKRFAFVINERMLHFPEKIAGPAFQSLCSDLISLPKNQNFDYVLIIVKIRANDVNLSSKTNIKKNKKKKVGRAEKKRLASEKMEKAELIFDNFEEALLFQDVLEEKPIYFQYPVQSDVEKTSKFHSTIRNGIIYRPYRRVCLLKWENFLKFAKNVVNSFS